jgi:hypothetical protein
MPMDEDGDPEVPATAADADEIVDLRPDGEASEPSGEVRRIVADDILDGLADPSYDELWGGTEAISLDVPDIPPLDLSWGDDDTNGSS